MNGLIPPGARVVLIGSAASVKELTAFTPLEAGTAEGSLMLLRLDFADFPTADALAKLEKSLQDAGVPAWPGCGYIVYADTGTPSVYLAWQKAIAWMAIIGGILAVTVLPALLGALLWWILPQSLKDLLSSIVELGMMMVVMWLMSTMMKPLTSPAKPKQVKKPEVEKPRELEQAGEAQI